MKVLRAADGRRTPWKNGGGETREIAVHPAGAGFEDFDWRVSAARVAADGPFSAFPGVDRTLVVTAGAGLELTVGDGAPVRLTAGSAPFAFPADVPCAARLIGGPVADLNVMTRRGRSTHAVRRLDGTGPATLDAGRGMGLVICREGGIAVGGAVLGPGDAVLFAGLVEAARCDEAAQGWLVLIRAPRATLRPLAAVVGRAASEA